ncbi:MAG: bifunctional diaminohydroxyphosphoribosylaminopyrimidine deaminase/5-amino-6-(5-phosphoribosylamino)uracil reductase RibD [Elainellaceae cyanobacterium]
MTLSTSPSTMNPDERDRHWMQQCLNLAQQAYGKTAPNPMVGSVIVQNHQVVGEGFHPKAGKPHAEVFALRHAGDRAVGATLYVNLEPCSHYGRTPPCVDAVIAANPARVVIGMVDPNPLVAGRGVAKLKQAGIEVSVGIEEDACQRLNEAFSYRIQQQRPFGILKYAMTLDGKIATTTGHSAWVTSPAARSHVHHLRAGCDAIIIGGNTVRRDNPLLTTHGAGDRQPLRVVMSRTLDLPIDAQIWDISIAPTWVFTESGVHPSMQKQLRNKGVEVIEYETLTPSQVMEALDQRQCLSALWECGGTLSAQAIATGAVQKVLAFVAPKIIGGTDAPSPVGELGLTKMTDALPLENISWETVGPDLLITGYL